MSLGPIMIFVGLIIIYAAFGLFCFKMGKDTHRRVNDGLMLLTPDGETVRAATPEEIAILCQDIQQQLRHTESSLWIAEHEVTQAHRNSERLIAEQVSKIAQLKETKTKLEKRLELLRQM